MPEAAGRLTYLGTSFGGGIGALALPWDDRFHAAGLTVPTFGNHPLRVTLPCTGSGESVRTRLAEDPSVLDVLAYFDAATAARHIKIPVHVGAALFDPSVPPPGQFAVYNGLAGPRELLVLRAATSTTRGSGPRRQPWKKPSDVSCRGPVPRVRAPPPDLLPHGRTRSAEELTVSCPVTRWFRDAVDARPAGRRGTATVADSRYGRRPCAIC